MSKLEEILQADVEAEIKEILTQADSQAAKMVSEAERRAAARLAVHRKKINAEERAALQQAQSAAALSVATARMQAKGEVMARLRQKVLLALEETASQPDYAKVLQALAEKAMQVAAAPQAVVAHPDDQEKLSDWARQRGLELKADPGLHLGVRIVSRSGKLIENTLPERLHRAWDTLAAELNKLLWE